MKLLLFCTLLLAPFCLRAQQHAPDSVPPSFPGGPGKWQKYLQKELKLISPGYYIPLRKGQKDSTQTVIIEFMVDSSGAIHDVHYVPPVVMSPFLLDRALKIIRFAPNWQPATITGRAVNYKQRQSITFHVSDR